MAISVLEVLGTGAYTSYTIPAGKKRVLILTMAANGQHDSTNQEVNEATVSYGGVSMGKVAQEWGYNNPFYGYSVIFYLAIPDHWAGSYSFSKSQITDFGIASFSGVDLVDTFEDSDTLTNSSIDDIHIPVDTKLAGALVVSAASYFGYYPSADGLTQLGAGVTGSAGYAIVVGQASFDPHWHTRDATPRRATAVAVSLNCQDGMSDFIGQITII